MLLPFQRYVFVTSPSIKELQRKFLILLEQKYSSGSRAPKIRKSDTPRTPLFTGAIEGDRFYLILHKYNGDEDIVKVSGVMSNQGDHLQLDLRLLISGSWMVTFAGSIVLALVAAYMYGFIGENLFDVVLSTPVMPYLILVVTAIYINLKRFSNKAFSMLEQIVYWLELE